MSQDPSQIKSVTDFQAYHKDHFKENPRHNSIIESLTRELIAKDAQLQDHIHEIVRK
jgi:hypothetical protein